MARQARRTGGRGARPPHRGADGRGDPGHVHRPVRVRPAPLRGADPVHDPRGHPRPRADGRRDRGRLRRHRPAPRRPGGRPVPDRLRLLLHVRPRAPDAVRDHPGQGAGHGRRAVRLHQAVRLRARRPGRVPAGAAGPLRPDHRAARRARRPVPVPLRRPAHGLPGGGVRGRSQERHPGRARARPDRRHVLPHRPAPGRGAGHRHRPRARTDGESPCAGRDHAGRHRQGRRRRGRARPHRRQGRGRGRRRGRHGGPRRHRGKAGAEPGRAAARPGRGEDRGTGGRRPAVRAVPGHRARPPRRHRLPQRRLRRHGRPAAHAHPLRQADPAAHGPGQRAALGARHPAAARRGRPAGRRRLRHPPPAARPGARRLRHVPAQGDRQGRHAGVGKRTRRLRPRRPKG